MAKALIALGVQSHEVVCIIGFNAPEWMMANLGSITVGGIAAGIYTTNSPTACQYIAKHSSARVVVCENIAQLVKFLVPTPDGPNTDNEVLAYVVYGEDLSACATSPHATLLRRTPNIYSWIGFLQLGVGVDETALDARIRTITPGKPTTSPQKNSVLAPA